MSEDLRIAVWSGPRNISTAMMRSFGNREDTFVCDEPLYAHYLRERPQLDHPGRDQILAHHEADWRKVADWLCGPIPEGHSVFYQKHMAHHLLPEIERDWLAGLQHVFLIREPREMLTSLMAKLGEKVTLEDTGLPQQLELFRWAREQGHKTPVLDARDVLENPRAILADLCGQLDIPFDDRMLEWPPGRRATDGIWAEHWYDAVDRSTGFQPYRPKDVEVPAHAASLLEECETIYRELHPQRIRARD